MAPLLMAAVNKAVAPAAPPPPGQLLLPFGENQEGKGRVKIGVMDLLRPPGKLGRWPWRLHCWHGFAGLGYAGFSLAQQRQMTVPQLVSFIRSSIQLRQDDHQVADVVRRIKLSTRLDAKTVEELEGLGAGPQTVAALKQLVTASASLAPSAALSEAGHRAPGAGPAGEKARAGAGHGERTTPTWRAFPISSAPKSPADTSIRPEPRPGARTGPSRSN